MTSPTASPKHSILVFVFDADPDVPELIELLQSKYGVVTATRFEFERPIVPVPAWWETLPNHARLRVINDTTIWYDSRKGRRHSDKKKADETLTYWGKYQDGMLCVFQSMTLSLWVNAGDVQPI